MPDRVLLMGNEAIARGALEAGASFCAGYPGNPSSEIIDTLLSHQSLWPDTNWPTHVEWSVNEIVGMEAAAAAAFAGLRALVCMKQNGISVCADFLTTVNLPGLAGGALVVVVCDDPGPLTSSNEQDSRYYAKLAMLPLLEPSTPQQAKEMMIYAFDLSERTGLPVLLRSVSRLSHGRGPVRLGIPARPAREPRLDPSTRLLGLPKVVTRNHQRLVDLQKDIRREFEASSFNSCQTGAGGLLVVAAGLGVLYAHEAVTEMKVKHPEAAAGMGLVSLGALWPFPKEIVAAQLARADSVLVVEQVEPFVEEQVKQLLGESEFGLAPVRVYGKASGHMPACGEIDTDTVLSALGTLLGVSFPCGRTKEMSAILADLPPRDISFCSGCPHRASFWAIKSALALDGRNGIVTGDIGCYGLAAGPTGFSQLATLHCMGAGVGEASGFGVLSKLGFEQPVVAVAGDSTFFHACIPALINARLQKANLVFVILDNSTTAMTGFQPHPGTPCSPLDPDKIVVAPEDICRGIGVDTIVLDPVADIQSAVRVIYEKLQQTGVHALIMRRACAMYAKRIGEGGREKAVVDASKCRGEECGCDRFCSRILACPGNRFDETSGKAYVDTDYCNGCGLCVTLCPSGALSLAVPEPEQGASR